MKKALTDRYVTYKNIDCAGNAKRIMAMLLKHIDDPQKSNVFWEKYREKLQQVDNPQENHGRQLDELFLIHTYINNLYEISKFTKTAKRLTCSIGLNVNAVENRKRGKPWPALFFGRNPAVKATAGKKKFCWLQATSSRSATC
jgi:cell fate (sporulation/competence/biofilm development) regulator YmcA (YheA/YmcA/DUF963 family)